MQRVERSRSNAPLQKHQRRFLRRRNGARLPSQPRRKEPRAAQRGAHELSSGKSFAAAVPAATLCCPDASVNRVIQEARQLGRIVRASYELGILLLSLRTPV